MNKKLISIFLLLAITLSVFTFSIEENKAVAVESDSSSNGSVKEGIFTFWIENGEASITRCDYDAAGDIVIPESINGYPVTSIDDNAFWSRKNIKSVTLPNTIKKIEANAFMDCTNLANIVLPDNLSYIGSDALENTSYYNNVHNWENDILYIGKYLIKAKTDISGIYQIAEGTELIASNAFWCCELTNVKIPNTVKTICSDAFAWCRNINNIEIPDSVTSIQEGAFDGCISLNSIRLSSKIKTISEELFYGCENLLSVDIPDGVTTIGDSAFGACYNMTEISIPDSVVRIGSRAFSSCNSLVEIELPRSLMYIGEDAFSNCSIIETITIPENVQDIALPQFTCCYKLKKIVVDVNNNYYSSDENGILYDKDFTEIVYFPTASEVVNYDMPNGIKEIEEWTFSRSKLEQITIPDSVYRIGANAFSNCTNLKKVVMSKNVKKIESCTFYWCVNLENIVLPENLLCIEWSAFSYCYKLNEIIIPKNVKRICSFSFNECKELEKVVLPYGLEVIEQSAFADCKSLTAIDIPNSVVEIGERAFSNCLSLENLKLSDSLKVIGFAAFEGCSCLESITVPSDVERIEDGAFFGCIDLENIFLPDKIKHIGNGILYNTKFSNDEKNWEDGILYIDNYLVDAQKTIVSCKIKEGTKVICTGAFYDCENLTEVDIPDSIINIGRDSFSYTGYYNDENNWDDGVLYIGKYLIKVNENKTGICEIKDGTLLLAEESFMRCYEITDIYIPASVVTIEGMYLFYDCRNLNNISVDLNNQYFSSDDNGVLYNKEKTVLIKYPNNSNLTKYDIPLGVEIIGDYAFEGTKNITEITVPETLKTIGKSAFQDCRELITVTSLPQGLTQIGSDAFSWCVNLKNIELPEGINEIGEYTFKACRSFDEIKIPNSVTYIGSSIINDCSGLNRVIYNGTPEEWGRICFSSNNYDLLSLDIMFKLKDKSEQVEIVFSKDAFDADLEDISLLVGDDISESVWAEFKASTLGEPAAFYRICPVNSKNEPVKVKDGYKITIKIKPNLDVPVQQGAKFLVWHKSIDPTVEDEKYNWRDHGVKYDENTGYVIFEVEHFSYFIICLETDAPTIKIRNNTGVANVNYGDVIRFTAEVTDMPEGARVCWYVDGVKSGYGETFEAKFKKTCDVWATVVDAEGREYKDYDGKLINDSQKVNVNASIWMKIISFFKDLFGIYRTVIQFVTKP